MSRFVLTGLVVGIAMSVACGTEERLPLDGPSTPPSIDRETPETEPPNRNTERPSQERVSRLGGRCAVPTSRLGELADLLGVPPQELLRRSPDGSPWDVVWSVDGRVVFITCDLDLRARIEAML